MSSPLRHLLLPLGLCATLGLAACGSPPASNSNTTTSTTSDASAPASSSIAHQNTTTVPSVSAPPISTAHGGAATSSEKPNLDTSELDARIAKAEARAKRDGATQTDKLDAAAAYMERGNVYYNAGQPMLYKFALGDFRRALRYQPDNAEAHAKIDQMVEIYQSMGRPVPNNGLEP